MRNGNRKKLIQLIRPLDGKFCDTLRKLKSKLVEDSLRIMSLTGSQDVNVAVCDASSSEIVIILLLQLDTILILLFSFSTFNRNFSLFFLCFSIYSCFFLILDLWFIVGANKRGNPF